jgi:hypothetical protein
MNVEMITAGLSEVFAPKSRGEKNALAFTLFWDQAGLTRSERSSEYMVALFGD